MDFVLRATITKFVVLRSFGKEVFSIAILAAYIEIAATVWYV